MMTPIAEGRDITDDVSQHLHGMRRLISEARDRINELETCLKAIDIEVTITIHQKKSGA